MQQIDEARASATRRLMAPVMEGEGAARRLAMRSGLSEQTIRTVATTGIVSSMRTAAALEAATDGAVPATQTMQPGARGEQIYNSFPGDAILKLAIERRLAPSDILASAGITHQDLSIFTHGGEAAPNKVKERVTAALKMLSVNMQERGE